MSNSSLEETIGNETHQSQRVTYLLGAGATHGGAKAYGSSAGVLMKDLSERLVEETRSLIVSKYHGNDRLRDLANEVIGAATDYEHIITFLDDSVAVTDREFAQDLRLIFSRTLRSRLESISTELGGRELLAYATLVDIYNVEGFTESLMGFMTLNYDDFLEAAIEVNLGGSVDYGVQVGSAPLDPASIKVLKLHGSFSWGEDWPITRKRGGDGQWIPPGIRKKKTDYPFNLIWGKARELLNCDLLRIVGCNLGANDWDLISLLFTTKYLNASGPGFKVELITDMETAVRVQTQYPYLNVRHFAESEDLGPRIINEMFGTGEILFATLAGEERAEFCRIFDKKIGNPVHYWLMQMTETMKLRYETISTPHGCVEAFSDQFEVEG